MNTQLSTNRKSNKMFANILSFLVILAMALVNAGSPVQAAENPSASNWDGSAVLKPSVLYEASGYKLWYDGVDFDGNTQVGLAKSKDGMTWKKYPQNPVLEGEPDAWDASGEHAAFVMKEGNLYKMWYEGFDGSVRQLGYATSPDGITWTKYPGNPVLQAGPEGYDQIVAGHGSVLYEDGLYKLWYHAIGDQGIIIAFATSEDGINWTKHGPALLGSDGWDSALWGPSVLKVNGTYWMWYSAAGSLNPSIGLATSEDGENWERYGGGPVLTDPNAGFIGDPHVIYDGGLFKMWYGNFSDGAIYYTESADGIYWTDPMLALFPAVSTQAGSASPFAGSWQATDVDGSDMSLTIGGRPGGPFQITWTDDYISLCNGEAGIVRGTGWLNENDPSLLEADVHLECFTTEDSLDFHVTFRYHPGTNTLSIIWSFEQGQVTIWYRPGKPQVAPPTLNLRVNYGHDWVESFYEGGHMVSVMVTDSDGNVKATAELVTEPKDFWGGETGFATQAEGLNPWNPGPPDIQPYDWVYGWVDNGASAQVQIGDISGTIDLNADSIGGTINAPWFPDQQVEVECLPWGAPKPLDNVTYGMVVPDNVATYFCSWSGQWNILPYQDVGVGYSGPDGHWVANAFHASAPQIVASESGDWFWTTGFTPGPLELAIYASADEGAALLWSGQQDADESGFTFVGYDIHGQDLVEGNYLVVSDGVYPKSLTLLETTVTVFDTEYDFMAGLAPAGSEVWAAAGPQDWQQRIFVEADPDTGEWLADFAAIEFDITEEMQPWSYSSIYDGDGDANEGSVPPLEFWVAAYTYDHGTWSAGDHSYHFEAEWNGGSEITGEIFFNVSNEAELYDGFALLRPGAVRAGADCPAVDAIQPEQVTRFMVGYLTEYAMTLPGAQAYFDSLMAEAIWDGGMSADLLRHEIIPFSAEDWPAYACSFTSP